MKLISIKCLSNSKTTLEMNELHFESENLAAKIVVDYSSTAVSDWNKVVKCFMADGSFKVFNLNTDPIVEAGLDSSVTIAGNMTIQVYAIASGDPNAMKVMFEERIVPFKGITKDGDPAAEHPDLIDEIFLDITNLENTKSDKTYVDTELAKKVDKATGKSLIDDAEIIRLSSVDNYDDSAVQQAITDLDEAKVNKVIGQGLSDQNYTLAEKQKLAAVEPGAQVNQVNSVAGKTGDVTLVKNDVGLGNVDNTSDTNKPISTAQQTAIDTKVDKLMATNLITNGDFSNGINNWQVVNGTSVITSPKVRVTSNVIGSNSYRVRTNVGMFNLIPNNKYYLKFDFDTNVDTTITQQVVFVGVTNQNIHESPTKLNAIRTVFTNLYANTQLQIILYGVLTTSMWFDVSNFSLINLTTIFGAGKEPTALEMDNLLANFPNSWFDGTQELINYGNLVARVVNLRPFITPTLLNSRTGTLQYTIRNNMVVFKGTASGGSLNTNIMVLPAGYRPAQTLTFPISANGAFGVITIATNGEVRQTVGALTNVFLAGIVFMAEV